MKLRIFICHILLSTSNLNKMCHPFSWNIQNNPQSVP